MGYADTPYGLGGYGEGSGAPFIYQTTPLPGSTDTPNSIPFIVDVVSEDDVSISLLKLAVRGVPAFDGGNVGSEFTSPFQGVGSTFIAISLPDGGGGTLDGFRVTIDGDPNPLAGPVTITGEGTSLGVPPESDLLGPVSFSIAGGTASEFDCLNFSTTTFPLFGFQPGLDLFRSVPPYFQVNGNNQLEFLSDDGLLSGCTIELPISTFFTLEFDVEFCGLPPDLSSPDGQHVFIGAFDRGGAAGGLMFSKKGLAITRDPNQRVTPADDSGTFFSDFGPSTTFRLVVDPNVDRSDLYITETSKLSVAGQIIRYTTATLIASGDAIDSLVIQLKGSAQWPAHIRLNTLNLSCLEAVRPPAPPVGLIGLDATSALGDVIRLSGERSIDVDNRPLSWKWWVIDMPETSGFRVDGRDGRTFSGAGGLVDSITSSGKQFTQANVGDVILLRDIPIVAEVVVVDPLGAFVQVSALKSVNDLTPEAIIPENLVGQRWTLFRQNCIDDQTFPRPDFIPDSSGLYEFRMVVTNGDLDSRAVFQLLEVQASAVPFGVVPDLEFVWDYLSDFWQLVDERDPITACWSAFAQVAASSVLTLWQTDYGKSLNDIQRTLVRKWLHYDPYLEFDSFALFRNFSAITTFSGVGAFTAVGSATSLIQAPSGEFDGAEPGDILYLHDENIRFIVVEAFTGGEGARLVGTLVGPFNLQPGVTATVTTTTGGVEVVTLTNITAGAATAAEIAAEIADQGTGITALAGADGRLIIISVVLGVLETISILAGDFALTTGITAGTSFGGTDDDGVRVQTRGHLGGVLVAADVATGGLSAQTWTIERTQVVLPGLSLLGTITSVGIRIGDAARLAVAGKPGRVDPQTGQPSPAFCTELEVPITGLDTLLGTFEDFPDFATGAVKSRTLNSIRIKVDGTDIHTVYATTDFNTDPVGIRRYQSIPLPDLAIVDVPILSGIISFTEVEGAPDPIIGSRDYQVVDGFIQFSVGVHDENNPPPDKYWAEVTRLDNVATIENNFGLLVDVTEEEFVADTVGLDYLSAVRGLWYTYTRGPSVRAIEVGTQILLALPFAERRGIITEINPNFDPTNGKGRILVQDLDGNVLRPHVFFTADAIAVNPATEDQYVVGDIVERFDPLTQGTVVQDYITDPLWWVPYLTAGDGGQFTEVRKLFTFRVVANATNFSIDNIGFVYKFLEKVKPTYTNIWLEALQERFDSDLAPDDDVEVLVTYKIFENGYDPVYSDGLNGAGRGFDDFDGEGNISNHYDDEIYVPGSGGTPGGSTGPQAPVSFWGFDSIYRNPNSHILLTTTIDHPGGSWDTLPTPGFDLTEWTYVSDDAGNGAPTEGVAANAGQYVFDSSGNFVDRWPTGRFDEAP